MNPAFVEAGRNIKTAVEENPKKFHLNEIQSFSQNIISRDNIILGGKKFEEISADSGLRPRGG